MSITSTPLFIVGMPRSGTKLLRGMLNRHPEIGIPLNETEFLPAWIRRWAGFGDLSQYHTFMSFYQQFNDTFYFQNRMREHGQMIKPDIWYLRCDGDFSISNVFEQLVRHDADLPTGRIWGDKSPSYVRHIADIRAIFPNAKFIHLVRDARDYILSLERAFGKNRVRAAQRWNDSVLQAERDGQALGTDFCTVRYEDLVDHPQVAAEKICTFLEIDFVPEMVELSRAPENIGDAKGHTEIMAGNYGKYRTQMTPAELEAVESYCIDALRAMGYNFGYQGSLKRLSNLELRRHQLGDAYRLIQRDAETQGWIASIESRVGHFIKVMF